MKELKLDKQFKILNYFMFISVFVGKILIEVLNEKGITLPGGDDLKYFLVAAAVGVAIVQMLTFRIYEKKNRDYIFKKELIILLIICAIFLLYSGYLAHKSNVPIARRTYVEILYLVIPALYAFCIVNTYDFNQIEKLMKITFWSYLILYMYSINIFAVSINDILNISFIKSTSYFESSIFAFPMLVLFFFFSYYRKNKNNKYYWIGSFILTLLTFKRMIMVWAIVLFILDNIIELRVIVKKRWKYILAAIFIFATVIYYQALCDTGLGKFIVDTLGVDLESGTMGRKWFLSLLFNRKYSTFGYGSSSIVLGEIFNIGDIKYLEMDLVKIYLELGIICLSIFTIYLWKITKDNLFSIVMMLSIFMNSLVSHSLTNPFEWTIVYLTIIYISQGSSNRNDLPDKINT